MMKSNLEAVLNSIKKQQALSGSSLVTLNKLCGTRFWKAIQAVANDLVKKYVFEPSGREAWVVVGKTRDYRVLSEIYCDCEDFYINVIVKRNADLCYHILAQILADALNSYSKIRVDDMRYDNLRAEWERLLEKPVSQKTKKEDA
jgi:predicted nucleic acid-binding Zn finger protein